MKKIFLLIPIILLLPILINAQNKTCIYFFYGDGCPHCANVEPFINEMAGKYEVTFHKFEIYHNSDNAHLMNTYFTVHNVPQEERGIPSVFIADRYLTGDVNIQAGLEKLIREYRGAECPTPEKIAEEPSAKEPLFASWQIVAVIVSVAIVAGAYILYQRRK